MGSILPVDVYTSVVFALDWGREKEYILIV